LFSGLVDATGQFVFPPTLPNSVAEPFTQQGKSICGNVPGVNLKEIHLSSSMVFKITTMGLVKIVTILQL